METTGEAVTSAGDQKEQTRRDVFFLAVVGLAVWAQLLFKLRIDWATNAQYGFGPFVPLFIVYLVASRWKDRPDPGRDRGLFALVGLVVVLFALIPPLRLVQEANPDWRPLNWVHASLVTTLMLCLAFYYGGWPWVGHFSLPLLLLFFALPWPLKIEQTVIQTMARGVASVTAELLNLAGVPALQEGNVIRVPAGPVGIQDACTGVRSLAGTLMSAVFFGEFFRLDWLKRLLVLCIGIAVAFLLNLVRTFVLAWIAGTQGLEAIAKWHDQTGFIIFLIAFVILWWVGAVLPGRPLHLASEATRRRPLPAIKISLLVGLCVWLAIAEGATEGWYRLRERNLPHFKTWEVQLPAESDSFRRTSVTDEARAILRYTEGHAAVFKEPGFPRWQIYFFRWEAGRSSAQLAVLHRPEICLPAAGLKFITHNGKASIQLDGVTIPFECSTFDSDGTPLYVFRTLCEDRRPPGVSSGFDQSIAGRLQSAGQGRRNLGQKLLQIGISGVPSQQRALDDLETRLPRFLAVTE